MGKVVVMGSVNMDLVVQVATLPRPGETVLGDRLTRAHGGKGANQAVAAARLGARVRFIGRVGRDAFGDELLAGLREDGVDVAGVSVDDAEPSGAALIVVERGGDNEITVAPGANSRVGADEVARLRDGLGPDDIVLLQLEVPQGAVEAGIAAARDAGARVILNAAPYSGQHLPRVDVLIVNETERRSLGEWATADTLVVTLGASGADVVENGKTAHVDSPTVKSVDATGAGDAFAGAFAVALIRGSTPVEAARFGCAAGAAAVTKLGARPSLPRPGDLRL